MYNNDVVANEGDAKNFIGVVKFRGDASSSHSFAPSVRLDATGKYVVEYKTPSLASLLSVEVSYRVQSSAGVVSLLPLGSVQNATVESITLDKQASSVSCDNQDSVAGSLITCRVTAVKEGTGEAIAAASYANALRAVVKSTGGESKLASVAYSGLPGIFFVRFTMYRTGVASMQVQYRSTTGYVNMDDNIFSIVVHNGPISSAQSKVECFSGTTALEKSSCVIAAFDEYGNVAGEATDAGGFSIRATRQGFSTIRSTDMAKVMAS
jgi:hypothetical protein